ncbi:hypothetical protein, partial [Lacticaseibacillus manihotivorans]|uniref:hypothetical protein n=1 Tax=Lacticaseibacillus manihotivorans TaxID=88233 RepID=UPI001F26DEF3
MRIFPYPFLVDLSRLDEEGQATIRNVLANNQKYVSVRELIRGISTQTDYCLIDMATAQIAQLSPELLPRHVVLDFVKAATRCCHLGVRTFFWTNTITQPCYVG